MFVSSMSIAENNKFLLEENKRYVFRLLCSLTNKSTKHTHMRKFKKETPVRIIHTKEKPKF
jgi:hypothetical protein